jgi:hypothetical protein
LRCVGDDPPERTTASEECYKDVRHHIILSYGALSREIQFKTMDGLSGKYPINLHASSLQDKQIEYNHVELRNLYALPLKLNRRQLLSLIYHLNFEHWNLDGRYYFVSRNCATEVGRALLASGHQREEVIEIMSNNPRRLFENLLKSNLSSLRSVKEIRRSSGLFFGSSHTYLNQALQNIRSLPEVAALKSVDEYAQIKNQTVQSWLLSQVSPALKIDGGAQFFAIQLTILQALLEQELLNADADVKKTFERRILEVYGKMYEDRLLARLISSKNHYGLPNADEANEARVSLAQKIENFIKNETLINHDVVKDIQVKLKPQRELLNQLIKSY